MYPILIIVTNSINIIVLISCLRLLIWNVCPIIIYLLWILLIIKYPFYFRGNKIRFILNNSLGIIIQLLLMIRHILLN